MCLKYTSSNKSGAYNYGLIFLLTEKAEVLRTEYFGYLRVTFEGIFYITEDVTVIIIIIIKIIIITKIA
jgi:hypothetical protein